MSKDCDLALPRTPAALAAQIRLQRAEYLVHLTCRKEIDERPGCRSMSGAVAHDSRPPVDTHDDGFGPETPGRTLFIRAIGLTALAVSIAYLCWRVMFTIGADTLWLAVPFFMLEVHAVVSLALFAFSTWDIHSIRPGRRAESTPARVAVLIPTYNETSEVLLPTIAAAVALRPAHETWVLDDGDREEIRVLAGQLGANYLTRPDRSHAKSGNLNHALGLIDADFIAVLDADHVATANFLVNTLGYFDDPEVALVQTPQDFYNIRSFEHDVSSKRDVENSQPYHEETLFYRVIQPGKNRWGGAFWCGTNAVLRTAALRSVGGVATDTITEDIHTTVRLHRRGWKSVYHNEVLARGLAARNAAEYQDQRYRWGTGAMQLLKKENPFFVSGLTLPQRLSYAATILAWFESWRSLGYLAVPMAVLFTGASPVAADLRIFAPIFVCTFVMQQFALKVLSRRQHRPVLSALFDLVRMQAAILATLNLFRRRHASFKVTPKGPEEGRNHYRPPQLLTGVLIASVAAAVWTILTMLGLTLIEYTVLGVAIGAAIWLVINSILIGLAVMRVRSERFGSDRRSSVRFDASLPGLLGSIPCRVDDVSLTGALIKMRADAVSGTGSKDQSTLSIRLGEGLYSFRVAVRSIRPVGDEVLAGVQFLGGQESEQARLALALFNSRVLVRIHSDVGSPETPSGVERDRFGRRGLEGAPAG
jgi:cellulose synthase/poly-beta-1,6-N-acetylglucosamine synthase-like glycosyltransferase